MAKFNVTITQTTIETCSTSVEAGGSEEAEQIVREMFENGDFRPNDWELDMEHGGIEFNVEGCPE